MHCPKCGQQQISEETRFCSRCGMLLTEVAKIVATDGLVPVAKGANSSARVRGLKHGLFFLLTSILFVPLAAIIALAVEARTPAFPAIVAFLTVVGGVLRMAYALLFESGDAGTAKVKNKGEDKNYLKNVAVAGELNAMPAESAAPFYSAPEQGKWRDTNDLSRQPGSVTDGTTKLLHHEHEN